MTKELHSKKEKAIIEAYLKEKNPKISKSIALFAVDELIHLANQLEDTNAGKSNIESAKHCWFWRSK